MPIATASSISVKPRRTGTGPCGDTEGANGSEAWACGGDAGSEGFPQTSRESSCRYVKPRRRLAGGRARHGGPQQLNAPAAPVNENRYAAVCEFADRASTGVADVMRRRAGRGPRQDARSNVRAATRLAVDGCAASIDFKPAAAQARPSCASLTSFRMPGVDRRCRRARERLTLRGRMA